jgi:hypothetical protein
MPWAGNEQGMNKYWFPTPEAFFGVGSAALNLRRNTSLERLSITPHKRKRHSEPINNDGNLIVKKIFGRMELLNFARHYGLQSILCLPSMPATATRRCRPAV